VEVGERTKTRKILQKGGMKFCFRISEPLYHVSMAGTRIKTRLAFRKKKITPATLTGDLRFSSAVAIIVRYDLWSSNKHTYSIILHLFEQMCSVGALFNQESGNNSYFLLAFRIWNHHSQYKLSEVAARWRSELPWSAWLYQIMNTIVAWQ